VQLQVQQQLQKQLQVQRQKPMQIPFGNDNKKSKCKNKSTCKDNRGLMDNCSTPLLFLI
jgi:hypothetical protein